MASPGINPPKPLLVVGENMAAQWRSWIRQFEWFATATQLTDKPAPVQAATFMACLGEDCARIYDTFELTQAERHNIIAIYKKFDDHFTPKSCVTYERYNFNQLTQGEGEQFDVFVTRVKEQSKKCAFGEIHDSLVKDRIIIGVKYTSLVAQLLNDELSLQKTIEMCKNFELTSLQSKALAGEVKVDQVKIVKNKVSVEKPKANDEPAQECHKCGRQHAWGQCPAFGKVCHKCGQKNHFSVKCKSRSAAKVVHTVQAVAEEESDDELFIGSVASTDAADDWYETVQVQDKKFSVKLDSGAHCNVIPLWLAQQLNETIRGSRVKWLVSFSNHRLKVVGEIEPMCNIKNKCSSIVFKVVEEKVIPVLGKETCIKQQLIARVHTIEITDEALYEGLGCLKNYVYDIDLVAEPQWDFRPARHVPHSLREGVKRELDAMERMGVIAKIHEPTPVVNAMVLVRRNQKLRICIDPSQVNQNLLRRHHPLTTMEEISARLCNSRRFTILDCKKGFWQIRVTERTSKYLTFSTPWGRYCYKRMPFGLGSVPEVFTKAMMDTVGGIDGVEFSMDDILIHAENSEKLAEITKVVIEKLFNAGLKLNKDKCIFDRDSVKFLGHLVTANGLKADPEKVEAISRLRTPSNKQQLQRVLGMITYLGKFIPNLSELTSPLRKLLVKDVTWDWNVEQENAFVKIKLAMQSTPVLIYYDVNAPVTLSVDASSQALGAVLLQRGRPVAYASRALTSAEENYPQIEKEATAIRFACQKFHQYVYGKDLTVETDHKPLESIFRKQLDRAPPRLRRIRLEVMPYSPTVKYVSGKNIPIPDILSRDVEDNGDTVNEEQLEVHIVLQMSKKAGAELRQHTDEDTVMKALKEVVMEGWPEARDELLPELRKYWGFRDELAVYDGLIFKSNQLMIPSSLRKKMLTEVHSGHAGIQSSLRRAKQILFWINMSRDIQDMVEACSVCQHNQRSNTKNTIISKDVPDLPFERVASDLFHFKGKEYILLTDSYSGFYDFKMLRETTSREVISTLKDWFSVHGVPQVLETDNGPQYASEEFRQFSKRWSFDHQTSSPHFPRANGLAERFVQVAKSMLKKCDEDSSDLGLALLHARNTPRSGDIPSPNERLMGRLVRTNLPMTKEALKPKVVDNVQGLLQRERLIQKEYADRGAQETPQFSEKERVLVQNLRSKAWESGEIVENLEADRSYLVSSGSGVVRRNAHHLRKWKTQTSPEQVREDRVMDDHMESASLPDMTRDPVEELSSARTSDTVPTTTRSGRVVKPKVFSEFEYY